MKIAVAHANRKESSVPTSVSELLKNAGLELAGRVNWGQQIRDDKPGIYIVSLSLLPDDKESALLAEAPIDLNIVRKWITDVPTLRLDGSRPTPGALRERLAKFWLPDEMVVYIGKAGTSVKKRVGQYYRTPLGDPKPHAGGHWIKTLTVLNKLSVFWSLTSAPKSKEDDLIGYFVQNVSQRTKELLFDPDNPFPFANIEYPKGNSKNHGLTGQVNRD